MAAETWVPLDWSSAFHRSLAVALPQACVFKYRRTPFWNAAAPR